MWEKQPDTPANSPSSWKQASKLDDAHPETINYLTTYKSAVRNDNDLYFTTMCKSGVLKLWVGSRDENKQLKFSVKSEILFGRNLQEVTELKKLGQNDLLLLTGGYDSKVHVYMT